MADDPTPLADWSYHATPWPLMHAAYLIGTDAVRDNKGDPVDFSIAVPQTPANDAAVQRIVEALQDIAARHQGEITPRAPFYPAKKMSTEA